MPDSSEDVTEETTLSPSRRASTEPPTPEKPKDITVADTPPSQELSDYLHAAKDLCARQDHEIYAIVKRRYLSLDESRRMWVLVAAAYAFLTLVLCIRLYALEEPPLPAPPSPPPRKRAVVKWKAKPKKIKKPPSPPPPPPPSPPLPPLPPYEMRPGMRTALLVRGYNPTESMVRRWVRFAESCNVEVDGASGARPVLFSVSLDVTNRSAAHDLYRIYDVRKAGAFAHTYTESSLISAFPGLRVLAAKYTNITGRPYRYGRFAIIEPILLWYQWLKRKTAWSAALISSGKVHHSLDYVWVMEQDVAASRPERLAYELLSAYDNDPSDLLTALPLNETKFAAKIKSQGSTGLHAAVKTPAFASAFPNPGDTLRTASIFVQRWSWRLAAVLEQAMLREHMHAWAEIAAPSLCKLHNLSIGHLDLQHRGALFHACCTKHVKTTSRNFLPDERKFLLRTNQSVVRLYHPVKF